MACSKKSLYQFEIQRVKKSWLKLDLFALPIAILSKVQGIELDKAAGIEAGERKGMRKVYKLGV